MTQSIGRKPVDAGTMAAAVKAAWRCRNDDALIEGQAAVTIQIQYDMEPGAPTRAQGTDAVDSAVKELEADHLPLLNAATLAKVEAAMRSGAGASTAGGAALVGPSDASNGQAPSASSIKNAASQLSGYLNAGATLPEALACISTQYGGAGCDPLTLACAALFVQAPVSMEGYLHDPSGPSPVRLAAATLMKYFDARTLDEATRLMAATPRAGAIDDRALAAATRRLAADTEGSAQYSSDMSALRAALADSLNAFVGEKGIAWIDDPTRIDAWLQGEATVVRQVLASANPAARERTSHDLGLALIELQTLAAVANATPVHQAGESPSTLQKETDVAQTIELTTQLKNLGVLTIDPATNQLTAPANPYGFTSYSGVVNVDDWTLYNDITHDPSIVNLQTRDVSDVVGEAGSTAPESARKAEADLRATSGILAEFKNGGALNYQDLLTAVTRSAPVQQRFTDLARSVHARHAVDVVHADAQILKSVGTPADADLTLALYQEKFEARFEHLVAHGTWNTADGLSVFWEHDDGPRYAMDVGDAYAALGDATTPAARTAAGHALLNVVKTRMDGNSFVVTGDGDEKDYDLNWIDKDGNQDVNPQLFQDIVTSEPHSQTAKFIEDELPSLNGRASAASSSSTASSAVGYAAPGSVAPQGSTQIITSRVALIDALGSAYGKTPVTNAAPGAPQYDGNDKVYGGTTLNNLADTVLASQNVSAPSEASPIEITLLPVMYWSDASLSKESDDQQKNAQLLQLIQVDGEAGRKYVGPASSQAFDSYDAWVQDNGLAKGTMLSQPHLTTSGAGTPVDVWGQTVTGPKQHVSNWDVLLQASGAILGFGVMGVASFVSPEADGVLGLLYDSSQVYLKATSVLQVADATQKIAMNPSSWRAWTSGALVTASSMLQNSKILSNLKLNGVMQAFGATPSEDPVIAEILEKTSGKRVVVFGGYSGLGYADEDAVASACAQDLEREIAAHGAENIIVVGGATSDGIGDIGYRVAKDYSIDTLGIVSEEARAFGASSYCDYVVYVPDPGQTWSTVASDGMSYMVTVAADGRGAYYAYGGGDIARDELVEAQQRGVPTVIHPEFEPNPEKVAARVAKNPAFEPQPITAAIRNGLLSAG